MFYSLGGDQILLIVMVVALVLVLVVMPIFTNKKRQQSVSMLHSSLKVGDKIMTIGGVIGTVKAINQTSPVDREIVIETGVEPNKTTMVMDIKALYQIIPPMPAGGFVQNNASSANASDVFEDVQNNDAEQSQAETTNVEEQATEPVIAESVDNQTEVVEEAAPVEESDTTTTKPRTTTAKRTNSTKK